ncbi:MAG TPA: DsrE family protein [Candidatus Angelobacter sp.]|nr:DsrE family protein [Candidatus Angelobacter sp.]
MASILVHLTSGPEHPTRGALAFLVARTAAAAGHDVSVFLAGDAVGYLRDATMDAAQGIGTGSVREHFDALAASGARIYASGMSSKARAVDADAIGAKQVEFAPPDRLVELIVAADRVVSY